MPRKKAVTNIEPTRRSSRLASREPSVASDTSEPVRKLVPKKKLKNEAATWDVEGAIRVVKYKARNETDKKVDIYITSLTEDQRKAMIIGFAKQTNDLDDRNDELEGDVSSLGASLKAATENPMRRHLTLQAIHEKYGKREAELPKKSAVEKEQPATAPSPQQQPAESPAAAPTPPSPQISQERPAPAAATPSSLRRILTSLGGFLPSLRKRGAEDEPAAQPAEKRLRFDETEKEQETPAPAAGSLKRAAAEEPAAQPTEKRLRIDEPERTPLQRPSAKNPRLETSLSTITEFTEPPSFLTDAPDTTPSKPSRLQPQSTLPVPQSTSPMPPSVPQSTPTNAFMVRRSAMLRAARSAGRPTPMMKPYAWERQSTPKPKEPNADVRQAKIQRMRDLQRELEELKQDEDIQKMEALSVHRRKRVKIDNLAVIPHNRPGDSASTFRVPDIDSDDEMEVDASVEERSNIFEDDETEKEEQQHVEVQKPVFEFPEVGLKPAEYHVTEDYQNQAGLWFEQGLEAFLTA